MDLKKQKYIYIVALVIAAFYFIHTKSSLDYNFKIIDNRNSIVFTTNNWFNYEVSDLQHNFKISIPKDWVIKSNVFYLDNKKLAEFSPGIVKLKDNQVCFDTEWFNETGESELISRSDLSINHLKGRLLIEKTMAWDGKDNNEIIYPYFYCLSKDNFAFVIAFYEKDINKANTDLHYNILKSIEF